LLLCVLTPIAFARRSADHASAASMIAEPAPVRCSFDESDDGEIVRATP
jgi:hypothetical protein